MMYFHCRCPIFKHSKWFAFLIENKHDAKMEKWQSFLEAEIKHLSMFEWSGQYFSRNETVISLKQNVDPLKVFILIYITENGGNFMESGDICFKRCHKSYLCKMLSLFQRETYILCLYTNVFTSLYTSWFQRWREH